MKYPFGISLAACVALSGCGSSHKSPGPPLRGEAQPSARQAPATIDPASQAHRTFADEIEALIRPVDEPGRGSALKARRSDAFTSATLPKRLSLTPADIIGMRNDIKRWVKYPTTPEGGEIKLYSSGVTTLDHWLHYGPSPRTYPPSTSSYYEMIYVDGLPIQSIRHDAEGSRLAQRVFYSDDLIPVCSVSYDSDEKPKFFCHLTYDYTGRIKQIVMLDERGEPLFAVCHAITGVYARKETITYKMRSFGDPGSHTLNDGERIFRIEANGDRKEVNRGAPLWWLTSLTKFGVRPLYPLPAGFEVPALDRYGAVVAP